MGIDFVEGVVFVIVVLEDINFVGVKCIVIIYYSEFKNYVFIKLGVENVVVEFDIEILSLIYKLFIGVFGKLNVFEIFRKFGLSDYVILCVKEYINIENIVLEDVL